MWDVIFEEGIRVLFGQMSFFVLNRDLKEQAKCLSFESYEISGEIISVAQKLNGELECFRLHL